jgi:hypothetical protein
MAPRVTGRRSRFQVPGATILFEKHTTGFTPAAFHGFLGFVDKKRMQEQK